MGFKLHVFLIILLGQGCVPPPPAEAGPIAWAACIGACVTIFTACMAACGPAAPVCGIPCAEAAAVCKALCTPLAAAPTP